MGNVEYWLSIPIPNISSHFGKPQYVWIFAYVEMKCHEIKSSTGASSASCFESRQLVTVELSKTWFSIRELFSPGEHVTSRYFKYFDWINAKHIWMEIDCSVHCCTSTPLKMNDNSVSVTYRYILSMLMYIIV